jgi:hypothetical protein
LGGSAARVGYSNGGAVNFELPGSGVPGSFLDGSPDSLVGNNLNSDTLGRYRFEVRNGDVAPAARILPDLTLDAGAGTVEVSAIGNGNDVGAVTVTGEGGVTLNGDITTAGGRDITLTGGTISGENALLNTSVADGDAGNVILQSTGGDTTIGGVDATSLNGTGGEVNIVSANLFLATDTFIDPNGTDASISTAGLTGGGDILIRHDGGLQGIPFVVGNAPTNGTAGAITSGDFAIAPPQSFPSSFTLGNVQIVTDTPPPPPPAPDPTPAPDAIAPPQEEPLEPLALACPLPPLTVAVDESLIPSDPLMAELVSAVMAEDETRAATQLDENCEPSQEPTIELDSPIE